MRRRIGIVGCALIGLAVLVAGAAELVARLSSVPVTLLSRGNSPEEQEEQRHLRDLRDDIAEIYGVPVGTGTVDVLGVDESQFIRPREDPDRRLLVVGPGEAPPLQARTLRFYARAFALFLTLLGLALVLGSLAARGATPKGPPRPRPLA